MRRKAGGVVIGAAAALAALVAWPAGALTPPPVGPPVVPPDPTPPASIGTLSATDGLLSFSGSVGNPTPLPLVSSPVPVVCVSPCKEFSFVNSATGNFLVSLKNKVTGPGGTFNANDGFDLYVYGPAGTLLGADNGIGADGQSLQITDPAPGKYTIVVTFTYADDPDAAYQGEVRSESGSTWTAPTPTCGVPVGSTTGCFYLPVMQAVPAYDLAVTGLPPVASTPLGFPLPVNLPTSNSCYLDESFGLDNPSPSGVENPTTRCLRFTSDVRNAGSGTLEVQIPWVTADGSGAPQSGFVPGECQAQQILTAVSGPPAARPAGDCEFHPEHAHFHYKNLISFTLYNHDATAPGGIGTPVGSALKESFCLSDDDYFGFASPGPNGPRQFVGQPGCNLPSDFSAPSGSGTRPSGAEVVEGISPGWGDVYTWDTPDQYIDITHVPAGTYDLVEETNPAGAILVAGPQQTCALTELQLTATTVTALATDPSVVCPA